jgi:hypothetical protein
VSDLFAACDDFKKRIMVEWWKAAIQSNRQDEQRWRKVLALDPQLEVYAQSMETLSEDFEAFRKQRDLPRHPSQAQTGKLMYDLAASRGVDLLQVLAHLGEARGEDHPEG